MASDDPGGPKFILQAQSFQGPIPPPSILQQYEQIEPGLANRIIAMAERQAAHRQHLEAVVIPGDDRRANTGMWLGFITIVLGMGCGTFLLSKGLTGVGIATAFGPLSSIGGLFLYTSYKRRQEREEKTDKMLGRK